VKICRVDFLLEDLTFLFSIPNDMALIGEVLEH